MIKRCILCDKWFEPKKSYYDTCNGCLAVLKNKCEIKKTEKWLPGKKEWDFIRENNNIMSPDEMASYFGIEHGELTREKHEMGLIIDEEGSSREYELHRCLNRFERSQAWGPIDNIKDAPNFLHRKRVYDIQSILKRRFTQRGELS
ncbi:MAG: hypothetical protein KAQ98_11840 [Bacteriovoracaceae bacterium]|nr:hypothetical protein [Bacteriovoracaceae bacterium]